MARTKGSYILSANIETNAAAPLDARERVATKSDLTASGSFPYAYVGMETYVVSEGKKYRLTASDYTQLSNWEEITSGGASGGHTIVDKTGTSMTQRANLQFRGSFNVSDDSNNNKTVVEIPDLMPAQDMAEIVTPAPTPVTFDIEDLDNVDIENLTNGQILKYNSTSSKWENSNESGGGGGGGITKTVLWTQSEGAFPQTIVLSESYENFDYLEFIVCKNDDSTKYDFLSTDIFSKDQLDLVMNMAVGNRTNCLIFQGWQPSNQWIRLRMTSVKSFEIAASGGGASSLRLLKVIGVKF